MDLSVSTHIWIFYLYFIWCYDTRWLRRCAPCNGFISVLSLVPGFTLKSICRFPDLFPQSLYALRGLDLITGLGIFCLNRSNILRIIYAVMTPWTSYAYKATHKVYTYRIGNLCPGMWEFSLFPGHVVLVTHSGVHFGTVHNQFLVKYVYVTFVQFLD